ncbi:MAG TPA: superoxide dismutase [Pseudonocardiaceae bacterium]
MIHARSRYPRNTWRLIGTAVFGAMVAVATVGCAYRGLSMATPPADPGWKPAAAAFNSATLAAPNPTSKAITYDSKLAPLGAAITAVVIPSADGSTTAQLTVAGLLPNRGYAVHAHTKACGVTADAAGPHFQNHIDPMATPQAPSSDPRYANPSNEIWLDVRTDSAGAGTSRTTVPFTFTARAPGSIVIHEAMQTPMGPGHAGKAGARLACLTLSGQ